MLIETATNLFNSYSVFKGGSRHFGLGGGLIQKDTKIRTSLGGSGGMLPQKIFDIFML